MRVNYKMIFCKSVDAYAEAAKEQVKLHGKNALKPRDYIYYPTWQLCIGFESPTGWWVLHVRHIRSWGARGQFHEVISPSKTTHLSRQYLSQETLIKAFGRKMQRAMYTE